MKGRWLRYQGGDDIDHYRHIVIVNKLSQAIIIAVPDSPPTIHIWILFLRLKRTNYLVWCQQLLSSGSYSQYFTN